MNMRKQLSLGVAFVITLSLTFFLIGSIKLLQAETSKIVVESQLVIDKSGPRFALKGEPVTYTISITNATSALTITSLHITDTLPLGATYIGGTERYSETLIENDKVLSWRVESLSPREMISFTFAVTATNTITNSDYRVVAAENISATGSSQVVTTIASTLTYLPIIIKQPKPTPTSIPTPTPTPMPTATLTPTPIPTATPTPPCLTAEEEPNNKFEQVDSHPSLCSDTDVLGSFPSEEKNNNDIYVIESKGGSLTISLSKIPAGTDYELELYRGTKRIAESYETGNQDEKISFPVEAGKYYARVFRFKGSSPDFYRIRWQNE